MHQSAIKDKKLRQNAGNLVNLVRKPWHLLDAAPLHKVALYSGKEWLVELQHFLMGLLHALAGLAAHLRLNQIDVCVRR